MPGDITTNLKHWFKFETGSASGSYVDFVELLNDFQGQSQLVIAVYVYRATPQPLNYAYIFGAKKDGEHITALSLGHTSTIPNSSDVVFWIANGTAANSYTTNQPITANTWHRIIGVFDGAGATDADKCKIYVDGTLQTLTFNPGIATATFVDAVNAANFPLIGTSQNTARWYKGSIDDLRVYSGRAAGKNGGSER